MGEAFISKNKLAAIPIWSQENNGMVLQIVNGEPTWNKINSSSASDILNDEYCWVISSSTVKVYSIIGTLLEEYDIGETWECKTTNKYLIELHAAGGIGGLTGYYWTSSGSTYTNYFGIGGGGGGSGAKIELDLTEGTTYPISVSTDVTTFDTYYCNRGENGTDGTVNGTTMTAGKGGSVGTYSDGMTCIANAGGDGGTLTENTAYIKGSTTSNDGGAGGWGGAFDRNNYTLYPEGLAAFQGNWGYGGAA